MRTIKTCSALTLAVALALGMAAGPASAASGGEVTVVTAKKKCKKKKKKKAGAAKKRGCKKKKKKKQVVATPPASTPTLRATLTWNTTADLDLHVWDVNGSHGWVESPGGVASGNFSADDADGSGPETFSDLVDPSTRQFAYGICTEPTPAPTPTDWTLTIRTAGGQTVTITEDTVDPITMVPAGQFDSPGDNFRLTFTGGAPSFNPGPGSNGWCTAANGSGP